MRILTVTQGEYGQRITDHVARQAPADWQVESWRAPRVLPPVIDYPEEYLPTELPGVDLLISLGEHPGVAELLPDIAQLCGAQAAILPIDNQAWLPPGLARQVAGWLTAIGVEAIFPKPFCSLTETTYNGYRRRQPYTNPLVAEFARIFGQPIFASPLIQADGTIQEIQVERDTPCGCACHVAQGLQGVALEEAVEAAGLLHHHYPCLGGMAIDPEYSDTLMHISGRLIQDQIRQTLQPFAKPHPTIRPTGYSSTKEANHESG